MSEQSKAMVPAQFTVSGTTKPGGAISVFMRITGRVVSMKNSRQILKNRKTGKPFSAKSSDAQKYVANFLVQVPRSAKLNLGSRDQLLRTWIHVWYPSFRQDLDCALIYDCLKLAGVISDDRWIRAHYEYALIDRDNPRCEISIEKL